MALSVFKETDKGNFPSSIWMVKEFLGILVSKGTGGWSVHATTWIPDHRGEAENSLPHPCAARIGEQLYKQTFATRREALQAIEVAGEMLCD